MTELGQEAMFNADVYCQMRDLTYLAREEMKQRRSVVQEEAVSAWKIDVGAQTRAHWPAKIARITPPMQQH